MQTAGGDVGDCRTASSGSSRHASTCCRRPRRSCSETPRSWAASSGPTGFAPSPSTSGDDGRRAPALARAQGVPAARTTVVRRSGRPSTPSSTRLVRDAVYGQLPRPDRVDRHVRVARWIESLPDDRREDRAELLAHHYVEAIELARSAGLDVARARAQGGRGAPRGWHARVRDRRLRAAVRALRELRPSRCPAGSTHVRSASLGKALVFTRADAAQRRAAGRSVRRLSPQ